MKTSGEGYEKLPPDEPEVPRLFEACRGIRFHARNFKSKPFPYQAFVLDVGVYSSGKGAIVVMTEDGAPELKLTVDLTIYEPNGREWRLTEDEFFVKVADLTIEAQRIHEALLDTGLFVRVSERRTDIADLRHPNIDEPVRISAGYEPDYARRWRFARCVSLGGLHERNAYQVECPGCRGRLDEHFERTHTEMLANNSLDRLKGAIIDDEPKQAAGPSFKNIPRHPRKR